MNKRAMAPEIDHSLLNQMLTIGKLVLLTLDRRLEAVDLSAAKLWALIWIASLDTPPTLTELADCMSSAKSNMTTMVDRLEKEGLVQRVNDPADRRVALITMTPAGRGRCQAGMEVFQQVNQELLQLFGSDGQAQFRHVRETLEQHLKP